MGTQRVTENAVPRRRYSRRIADDPASLSGRRRFRELVEQAIEGLPPRFAAAISNVDIVIAERPTLAELRSAGLGPGSMLLGLYHGTPHTKRGDGYHMTLPDKITLYRRSIEAVARSETALVAEVRNTLLHELAHHFGIDDARLSELGKD